MKCSCGRDIPFNEMVRKCSKCEKRLCSQCISAKANRQDFLCRKCYLSYQGRTVTIDGNIKNSKDTDTDRLFWTLLDRNDNMMTFEVEGKPMGGYGALSEISKMSDFLSEDRIMGVFIKFHIGRAYIPKDFKYPSLKVNVGTRDIKVVETVRVNED